MPDDVMQDQDFLKGTPNQQAAYLNATDPDFKAGTAEQQAAYLAHLTGQPSGASPDKGILGNALESAKNYLKSDVQGLVRGAYQLSAPGIATSLIEKNAPKAAHLIPATMRQNALPAGVLPERIAQTGGMMFGETPEFSREQPLIRERDATALNKPFAGEDFGPDTLVGKTKEAIAEGRANKLPTKVSSDYTPGAQNKILVHPGTAANEAAEAAGPARSARAGVIVAPEPTKTLIGGPKTAFSLPLGKPLDSAVQAGNADAALIKGVREGKPVILSPREGTGYPGPRAESAPIIERRGAGRSALTTPTEIEKRLATAPSTVRNVFDDTEGANATIARDVDRLVGPARPGEPVQIHGGHAGGGAASAEELARPGQHFIVTKNGVLNAEGKAFRPESTPSGGVHVTRMSDGTFKVNEGEMTPTIRKALDKLNAELGKK